MINDYTVETLLLTSFLISLTFSVVAYFVSLLEVNAKLPDYKQVTFWQVFLSPGGKALTIWLEHKRLCPHSRWRIYWVVSFLTAILIVIGMIYFDIVLKTGN